MTLIALLHAMQGQLSASPVVFYDQMIDLCLAYWTDGLAPARQRLIDGLDPLQTRGIGDEAVRLRAIGPAVAGADLRSSATANLRIITARSNCIRS